MPIFSPICCCVFRPDANTSLYIDNFRTGCEYFLFRFFSPIFVVSLFPFFLMYFNFLIIPDANIFSYISLICVPVAKIFSLYTENFRDHLLFCIVVPCNINTGLSFYFFGVSFLDIVVIL